MKINLIIDDPNLQTVDHNHKYLQITKTLYREMSYHSPIFNRPNIVKFFRFNRTERFLHLNWFTFFLK